MTLLSKIKKIENRMENQSEKGITILEVLMVLTILSLSLIFFGMPEYLKLFGVFLAILFFVACILSQIKFILDGYSYRPA